MSEQEQIERQLEFVAWLKENEMYNSMASAVTMLSMQQVYDKLKPTVTLRVGPGGFSIVYIEDDYLFQIGPEDSIDEAFKKVKEAHEAEAVDIRNCKLFLIYPHHNMRELKPNEIDQILQINSLEEATILIDDGETFEGNLKMFEDCFFSNASKETIEHWCSRHGQTVEFRYK